MGKKLTYKEAGVDIDEGERFVRLISPFVRKTFRHEVITDIGSFNALFNLNVKKYKKPVLVSGTDGVGTKLKIAFMLDRHDTVGIDLVAMCVNDILTSGAEPLFFLDYFATGRLDSKKATEVITGIVKGCKEGKDNRWFTDKKRGCNNRYCIEWAAQQWLLTGKKGLF